MSGYELADRLLNRMLDRIEAQEERRMRVTERAPETFPSAADREFFMVRLREIEAAGGITLDMEKGDARHLLKRAILTDPMVLYRALGRRPRGERIAETAGRLRAWVDELNPDAHAHAASPILALVARLEASWARNRKPYGIDVGDVDGWVDFFRCVLALLMRPQHDRRDLRTFSRKETGDSKLVERHLRQLLEFARDTGLISAELTHEEAVVAVGLEKFPQPVLLSGPVRIRGQDMADFLYIGISPEDIPSLEIGADSPLHIVTIENLASFNRHVREVKDAREIIVYTGGFPSRAVVSAVRQMLNQRPEAMLYHWGDIDPGGAWIADVLSRFAPDRFRLHLMGHELAERYGQPPIDRRQAPADSTQSDVAKLAAFLNSPLARHLEQEEMNPMSTFG